MNTVVAGFQMIDKTLTAVNKQLGLMRKESRMMCDEICAEIRSVAWEQKDARFAMEDLLDESRMNRYATEALHRTAKSVEDYARWTWIKDTRF